MANWCHNRIEISGPESSLRRFQEAIADEEGGIALASLYPTPSWVKDGRQWRVDNWGTSARLYKDCRARQKITQREDGDWFFRYSFSTAWSPPDLWLQKISGLFPELLFVMRYAEPGMNFAGCLKVGSGKVIASSDLGVADVLPRSYERWY